MTLLKYQLLDGLQHPTWNQAHCDAQHSPVGFNVSAKLFEFLMNFPYARISLSFVVLFFLIDLHVQIVVDPGGCGHRAAMGRTQGM